MTTARTLSNLLLAAPCALLLLLALTAGCEQPLPPGQTYHKEVILWPIFDVKEWEGTDAGTRWIKEEGDVCILGAWKKEKRYDDEGFLVYNREESIFFPLYSTQIEETEEFEHKKGSVLLWPYESYRDKSLERTAND